MTVDIWVEIDGSTLIVKEVTTTETCKENCECKNMKRQANKARRDRKRARKLAAKMHLENEARGGTLQAGGSGEGIRRSSQLKNGNVSNKKGQSQISKVRGTAGGRREREKSGSGEMEVITVESSEEETASELEEESQLLRIIKQQIGRK